MESYNNLGPVRDMSESQLGILLRYDSPPETPNEPTNMILSANPDAKESNDCNNMDNEHSIYNCSIYNREAFTSQMDSQIDFSVFHNDSQYVENLSQPWSLSTLNTQSNRNYDSVIMSTQNMDPITVETIEPSMSASNQNKSEKAILENDLFKFDKDENLTTEDGIAAEQSYISSKVGEDRIFTVFKGNNANVKICISPEIGEDKEFEEGDDNFDNIDFELISNLEKNQLDKLDSTNSIHRQLELKTISSEEKEKITDSYPAPIKTTNLFTCCYVHSCDLHSNIAKNIDIAYLNKNQNKTDIDKRNFVLDNEYITVNERQEEDNNRSENIPKCSKGNTTPSQICTLPRNLRNKMNESSCDVDAIIKTMDFRHESSLDKSSLYKTGRQICVHSQSQVELGLSQYQNVLFKDYKNEKLPETPLKQIKYNAINNVSLIPETVKRLYDIVKTEYSDFAFIYTLSAQLCQDRIPMECFVNLKMALLLSLASIGNNLDRTPISIVAMANDTYMTDYLMINIGQLATRFIGPTDDAKAPSGNRNWIVADPIILARGGVYYAGDWSRLKLTRSDKIFKSVECCSVTVEKSTLSYHLDTAIWTHWRSFKCNSKDQLMFNKFLKIFGIPIFVSDDNHVTLVDYTLEQASLRVFESTVDHLSINEDDMRNFLVYVSQCNVELSPEAVNLLENYFVASRSARQDCLTKQSYIVLKQFAESFCKLSMRNEVLTDDVLAAIILCEQFIENTFSSNGNSPPQFGTFLSVSDVDEYFTQFKQWLNCYLEKYTHE